MKSFDVFISYAIEDKYPVASEIVSGLQARGLKVYYVSDELDPGDSILDTVYEGLENSEYCVVVLSRSYVRVWPAVERTTILRRERMLNKRLIFPVRHGITHEEVAELFPELNDYYAESTELGLETVVENLYDAIAKRKKEDRFLRWKKASVIFCFAIITAVALLPLFNRSDAHLPPGPDLPSNHDLPSQQIIESLIRERVTGFQKYNDYQLALKQLNPEVFISLDTVIKLYNTYDALSSYKRNNYSFTNGLNDISGYANIQNTVFPVPASPHTAYAIPRPCIRLLNRTENKHTLDLSVAFTDTEGLSFQVDSVFRTKDGVHVWVNYQHYIRTVFYTLTYSVNTDTRKQSIHILSFKPKEEYILSDSTGTWKIEEAK